MERARAIRSLIDQFGLTHSAVAERLGLDRSSVTNLVRLTELEPEIIDLLEQGKLAGGHGKALLSAPAGAARVALARKAADEEWSVRATEEAATNLAAGVGEFAAHAAINAVCALQQKPTMPVSRTNGFSCSHASTARRSLASVKPKE